MKKIIQDQINSCPFQIQNPATQFSVDVSEPLAADFILDSMQLTHDQYEPTKDSLISRSMDRFFGEITKGYQKTEHMLEVGVHMLGIGRLSLDSKRVVLEPPAEGDRSYILTTMSKNNVIQHLKSDAKSLRVLLWVLGLAGVGLLSYYLYRKLRTHWERLKFTRMFHRIQRQHQEASRQSSDDASGQPDSANPCVVCLTNPREVIVLECGHVCLCTRCAERLPQPRMCPICRQPIDRFVAAFLS